MDHIEADIVYRVLRGIASEGEEQKVAAWWRKYPQECRDLVKELHAVIDAAELSMADVRLSDSVSEKVSGSASERAGRHRISIFRRIASGAAAAAAIVLLVAGAMVFSRNMAYDEMSSRMVSVKAPKGERLRITLPDGTSVFLNSGSCLTYPSVFRRDRRAVSLEGEALFDVMKDEDRPFSVTTFASEIRVLGTEFDVVADRESGIFETILVEGSTVVRNLIDPSQGEITMLPDDRIQMKNGHLYKDMVEDARESLIWTEGLIGIGDKSFDDLMSEFEKAFDVNIVITGTTVPDISDVSGKIRMSDGIENALRILQHAADFRWRFNRETNTVVIY